MARRLPPAAWQPVVAEPHAVACCAEDAQLSAAEKSYILANTTSQSKAASIPWGKLLSRKEVGG